MFPRLVEDETNQVHSLMSNTLYRTDLVGAHANSLTLCEIFTKQNAFR